MAAKNLFDSVVGFFSPEAGLRRARARVAYELIKKQRGYEGASKGRRTEGWKTPGTSVLAETDFALPVLRNRARDLVRNNCFASRAAQVFVSNIIGYGIVAELKNDTSDRKFSQLNKLWKDWTGSTQCDFDGRKDYYGLQALVMRMVAESGEALVIRKRTGSDQQIPFKLQVLEPDYIDTDKQERDVIQGVKFDESGRRIGYWLFKEHPGDSGRRLTFGKVTLESELVDAKDVLHVFREDRAGQVRGVSWFAPIIISLRDLDEYMDASIVKQKVAASFAGFVQDLDVSGELSPASPLTEKIEPGIIEILPPGKTITFPSPPSVNEFDPFTRSLLRSIASGLGITYEALTSDYSQVNFSSGRMGWLEFQRNLDSWRWQMFIPQFCWGVEKWFFEAAELRGFKRGQAYFEYTPPAREMIDPNAEINALQKAVRNGFKTLPEVIRELGRDPETQLKEIAASNALLDENKLILDSDPRRVMGSSGSLQPEASASSSSDSEDDASGTGIFIDEERSLWRKTANGFSKVV